MGERFLNVAGAAARVGRSRRTVQRWIDAGELAQVLGMVRESEVVETEHRMRQRIGRPKKSAPAPEPVAVVAGALGRESDAEVAVAALREAGLLPEEKT